MAVKHELASPDELISRTDQIVLARAIDSHLMADEERYGEAFDNVTQPAPKNLTLRERWEWLNKSDKTKYAPIKFTFETLETLKGSEQGRFNLLGYKHESNVHTKSDHSEDYFWNTNRGRTSQHFATCSFMPTFSEGFTYLIFLSKPYHRKSFELIAVDDDKWLQYVREKVKEQASELSNE